MGFSYSDVEDVLLDDTMESNTNIVSIAKRPYAFAIRFLTTM